jgi:hypothetical protein
MVKLPLWLDKIIHRKKYIELKKEEARKREHRAMIDSLFALDACAHSIEWAETQANFKEAWNNCSRPDWLMWLLYNKREDENWPPATTVALMLIDIAAELIPEDHPDQQLFDILFNVEQFYLADDVPTREKLMMQSLEYMDYVDNKYLSYSWGEDRIYNAIRLILSQMPDGEDSYLGIIDNLSAYGHYVRTENAEYLASGMLTCDMIRSRINVPDCL